MDPFGAAVGFALFVGVAACLALYPKSWRVPPGRFVGLALVLVLVMSLAAAMFGRDAAAGVAVVVFVVAAPMLLRRALQARAIERALVQMVDPRTRAESLERLARLLGSPPGSDRGYLRWSRLVHHVAVSAARLDMPEEAVRWAGRIDRGRVDHVGAASRAQVLAAAHLLLGDRARARACLGEVARPVSDPLWERALAAHEALLAALDGEAEPAEAASRAGFATEPDPILRLTWKMAHAHALAALGRDDEARAALLEVRDQAPDPQPLDRVVRHGGPASPLAKALLTETGAPYR